MQSNSRTHLLDSQVPDSLPLPLNPHTGSISSDMSQSSSRSSVYENRYLRREPSHRSQHNQMQFTFPSRQGSTSSLASYDPARQSMDGSWHGSSAEDVGGAEEEADADTNPLYILLSKSSSPELREAWLKAGLILLPPRASLPSMEEMRLAQTWVKGHAFDSPSADGKHWSSLGNYMRVTIEKSNGVVELDETEPTVTAGRKVSASNRPATSRSTSDIPFPSSAPSDNEDEEIVFPRSVQKTANDRKRKLQITAETTVYRKRQAAPPLAEVAPAPVETTSLPAPQVIKPKSSFTRLRTPSKWFRSGSISKSLSTASLASVIPVGEPREPARSLEPTLERLRVLSLDGPVRPWRASGQLAPASPSPILELSAPVRSVAAYRDLSKYVHLSFEQDLR